MLDRVGRLVPGHLDTLVTSRPAPPPEPHPAASTTRAACGGRSWSGSPGYPTVASFDPRPRVVEASLSQTPHPDCSCRAGGRPASSPPASLCAWGDCWAILYSTLSGRRLEKSWINAVHLLQSQTRPCASCSPLICTSGHSHIVSDVGKALPWIFPPESA